MPTPARGERRRLHPSAQRAGQPQSARPYQRHEAEKTVLYQIVSEELETFLDEVHDHYDKPLPAYVEKELRDFMKCGLLPYGLLRARCKRCGKDPLVALPCKRRGICCRCNARRMCGTAAHLTDRVIPDVPHLDTIALNVDLRATRWLERHHLLERPDEGSAVFVTAEGVRVEEDDLDPPYVPTQDQLRGMLQRSVAGRAGIRRVGAQKYMRAGRPKLLTFDAPTFVVVNACSMVQSTDITPSETTHTQASLALRKYEQLNPGDRNRFRVVPFFAAA